MLTPPENKHLSELHARLRLSVLTEAESAELGRLLAIEAGATREPYADLYDGQPPLEFLPRSAKACRRRRRMRDNISSLAFKSSAQIAIP